MSAFPGKPAGKIAWIAPIAVLAALLLVFGAIIVLSRRAAVSDAPAEAGPFQIPALAHPVDTWDVGDGDSSRLLLARGSGGNSESRELAFAAGMSFEGLVPGALEDVKVGDWLTAIGVPNDVRSFAVKQMVLIPGGGKPDEDGFLRSPGGFTGSEAARSTAEKPFAGGTVEAINGTVVTVRGLAGEMQFDILPNAPLRILRKIATSDIQPGDRIAFAAGANEATMSVLVLPSPPPTAPGGPGAGQRPQSGLP
ncbi:hypothetical protein AYO38_02080 [bacterium SCGC AG-212-C10]|nr:hypothetical protein AYO38_02080 [bacterium SCGC AG-212-C10]